MNNWPRTVEVRVTEIRAGDTIVDSDDIERTVGNADIRYDRFIGTTLFGSNYKSGHETVTKRIF